MIGPRPSTVLGLRMSAQKGIAVRGVLLDWAGWKQTRHQEFDAFGSVDITPQDLDAVAVWQGLGGRWSKPGDMLIIRTGWMQQYRALNVSQRTLLPLGDGFSVGV